MAAAEERIEEWMHLVTRLEGIFAREAAARAVPVGDLATLFTRLTERGLHLGIATMDSEALAHATMSLFQIGAFLCFVCGYVCGFGE